jgi:hypothetical protein
MIEEIKNAIFSKVINFWFKGTKKKDK